MHRSLADLRSIVVPFPQAMLWPTHAPTIDFTRFRGQHYYLWCRPELEAYEATTRALAEHDDWHLLDDLGEDESFGAITFTVDGKLVSRDLLDSVYEINYLKRMLGWQRDQAVHLLDVGAGYGRLAYRLCTAMPNAEVWCADAIPESTWLCQQYLDFRNCTRGHVVPFDEIATALDGVQFDVATAIHSWSECSVETIDWWVRVLAAHCVPAVLFVSGDRSAQSINAAAITVLSDYGYKLHDEHQGDIDNCFYRFFKLD